MGGGDRVEQPLNFVRGSRVHNPVATDLSRHLATLIRAATSAGELIGFVAPVIASSLLLDNYPPGAHST